MNLVVQQLCILLVTFLISPVISNFLFSTGDIANVIKNDKDFGVFHTMERLIHWASKEDTIYNLLLGRLAELQTERRLIDKHLQGYKGSLKVLAPGRLVTINNDLRKLWSSDEYKTHKESDIVRKPFKTEQENLLDFFLHFGELKAGPKYPSWQDTYTSYWAFIHIHEIYGSFPEEIYKGVGVDTEAAGTLTALQCAQAGMFGFANGYYYMAIEWFELAVKILKSGEEKDSSMLLHIVPQLLKNAIKTHNFRYHISREYNDVVNTYLNFTFLGQPAQERVRGREYYEQHFGGKLGNESKPHPNFLRLCKQDIRHWDANPNLKCYLERKLHPYFILNPVKTEQISEFPYIVQMYDVLGNDTINELSNTRDPGEREFELVGNGTVEQLLSKMKYRTSSSLALPEDGKLIDKINKKTALLTGLQVVQKQDEILQATEYIYGRYYVQHP